MCLGGWHGLQMHVGGLLAVLGSSRAYLSTSSPRTKRGLLESGGQQWKAPYRPRAETTRVSLLLEASVKPAAFDGGLGPASWAQRWSEAFPLGCRMCVLCSVCWACCRGPWMQTQDMHADHDTPSAHTSQGHTGRQKTYLSPWCAGNSHPEFSSSQSVNVWAGKMKTVF